MENEMERMESDVNDITWQVSPLSTVHEPLVAARSALRGTREVPAGLRGHGRRPMGSRGRLLALDRRGARRVRRLTERDLDRHRAGAQPDRERSSAGWDAERIYAFWRNQVGMAGKVMIDPQQHADTLFHVARRVGAL